MMIVYDPKDVILNLEIWLRNLIHMKLEQEYGKSYFDGKDENNCPIMKKTIIDTYHDRIKTNPNRFPRKINSLLVNDLKYIITKENFYKKVFSKVFNKNHTMGKQLINKYLEDIILIRNKLFHANPISQREYEKCICYSHDIIDLIKEHYKEINMDKEFNVPTILCIKDSLGNCIYNKKVIHKNELKNKGKLNIGDRIRLEVEIDNSFNEDDYKVVWSYNTYEDGKTIAHKSEGKNVEILITENCIAEDYYVLCLIIQNKSWHKIDGKYDDRLQIQYSVLPF